MMKMSSGSTPIPKPATLRFGVFFDGTGNNRHNAMAVDEPRGSYGNALSNVALLHALYPAGEADADGTRVFLKRYVEGVGTLAGEADHAYAAATGRGRTGVEARVAETLQGMAEQLRGWCRAHPQAAVTRVEFDLFGFSRGAAAARHLANLLQDGAGGLLPIACDTSINFIGLFDTVAAIIAPLQGDFDPADSRQGGLRLGLGAGIARQVVQLVAGEEPFIVPMAIPMIAGPSVIAALLLLSTQYPDNLMELSAAVILAWSGTFLILMFYGFFHKVLGERGLKAVERLMGLLLVMMSTQMFLNGIKSYVGM